MFEKAVISLFVLLQIHQSLSCLSLAPLNHWSNSEAWPENSWKTGFSKALQVIWDQTVACVSSATSVFLEVQARVVVLHLSLQFSA